MVPARRLAGPAPCPALPSLGRLRLRPGAARPAQPPDQPRDRRGHRNLPRHDGPKEPDPGDRAVGRDHPGVPVLLRDAADATRRRSGAAARQQQTRRTTTASRRSRRRQAAAGRPAAGGAPPAPPAAEARGRRRRALRIDNGRLHGSVSLRGGRIDQVTLADYHETIDPSSPEITLLQPARQPGRLLRRVRLGGGRAGHAVPDGDTPGRPTPAAGRRHARAA